MQKTTLSHNFDYKFSLKSTQQAIDWFKQAIIELKDPKSIEKNNRVKIRQNELLRVLDTVHTFDIGKMYLFNYDPKLRKSLPYYDTFPLIFLTGYDRTSFTGLNLHYLPIENRMILLSNLTQKSVFKDGKLDRLNIKYDNLKNVQEFQFFEPCFKKYLMTNVRSEIKFIPAEDWGYAAALPIEAFKKKTKTQVWSESMKSLDMTL